MIIFEQMDAFWNSSTLKLYHDKVLNFFLVKKYGYSNICMKVARHLTSGDKNGAQVSQEKTSLIKIERCSHTNFIWVIIFEHLDAFWNSPTFKLLHDQVLGFTRVEEIKLVKYLQDRCYTSQSSWDKKWSLAGQTLRCTTFEFLTSTSFFHHPIKHANLQLLVKFKATKAKLRRVYWNWKRRICCFGSVSTNAYRADRPAIRQAEASVFTSFFSQLKSWLFSVWIFPPWD